MQHKPQWPASRNTAVLWKSHSESVQSLAHTGTNSAHLPGFTQSQGAVRPIARCIFIELNDHTVYKNVATLYVSYVVCCGDKGVSVILSRLDLYFIIRHAS